MKKHVRTFALVLSLLVLAVMVCSTLRSAPEVVLEDGQTYLECPVCEGQGTEVCSNCGGTGLVPQTSRFYRTALSLLPPVLALALALLTKEVYSSLFVGILAGGLLYANFRPEAAMQQVLGGGIVKVLSDPYNVGILIFLVILGILVCLINKSGGSAAFGRWAETHIKTRVGAQLATIALGCLIFIDDYFNCLTVGSVMRPVTDKHQVSRAKLAYLIDSTAAPICIIAPISSWAAAVTGFVDGINGLDLFIRAIPYNFYAFLTLTMMLTLAVSNFDYGPMGLHEANARLNGDLFTTEGRPYGDGSETKPNPKGRVIDLVIPIAVLIFSCVVGMIYTGGFFEGASFIDAFANSSASVGLVYGSSIAFLFTIVYYILRRVLNFRDCMDCLPEGFKSMVPAIMILTFAWTLKSMTDSLGAREFVGDLVKASAGSFLSLLPAIVFLIAVFLSFSPGTSWGTFGIRIPIVTYAFQYNLDNEIMIIAISACLAGAVAGDHCSPISDTTIMASAGAQCDHINHVSTQLPYVITVTIVSFVCYIITGFVQSAIIMLPVSIALMIGTIMVIRTIKKGRENA